MGRRSLIPMSQINRVFSSINAARIRKEKEQLIKYNSGKSTEMPPSYDIYSFDFNKTNRVAHVDFLETKQYRTIERYVTQNYVRYPIYGDWKTKTKHIKKTLKLTNDVLERLNYFDDELIREFAIEIVSKINDEDLVPSWLMKQCLIDERDEKLKEKHESFSKLKEKNNTEIQALSNCIKDNEIRINTETAFKNKSNLKLTKQNKKLNKAKSREHMVFKTIITFGIIFLFKTKRRISKIEIKISDFKTKINSHIKLIEKLNESNVELHATINSLKADTAKKENVLNKVCLKITEDYQKVVDGVEPLVTEVQETTNKFIPLKALVGAKYEKIIGCYVIHNKEFDKYYVGQSKDVIKRITTGHFTGVKVKNIIFAEDYYKSSFVNKDDIFEVKIIRLSTKDELDRTEKELIELYDSFNSGYNGTSGNS